MPNDTTDQRTEQETAERRDELLRRLLHTPPQPRPKRDWDRSVMPKRQKPKKKTPAK